jgi:glycosyltransferase involved in cell wall biosynthesis
MTTVGVVIPTFNRRDFLRRAVESIREQTLDDVAVLVVDQGSTDGTVDFLEDRQVPWAQENRLGAGFARSLGLLRIDAEAILFLDSDDWLEPRALEFLHGALTSSGGLKAVYGPHRRARLASGGSRVLNLESEARLAPLSSFTLLRRNFLESSGFCDGDNYSWPRWVGSSRLAGHVFTPIHEAIGFRGIHNGNLSVAQDSFTKLLTAMRDVASLKGKGANV